MLVGCNHDIAKEISTKLFLANVAYGKWFEHSSKYLTTDSHIPDPCTKPSPYPFAKVANRVMDMLKQGLLDAAAAEKILGQKLPEGTPGQPSNGAKRSLDPADPNGSGEEEDLDTTLDALLHEHKKAKLEAQL